jgi:thiosulfate/3-mercaptopyruvate sulfurtransferase
MIFTTLVSAPELLEALTRRTDLVVLDASFDLADTAAGERSHEQAHIPGARYVHLDRDLSGAKTGHNGRHPLPDREAFAATVGRLGIGPGTQVVVYDGQGGIYAARAWWMLRWLGHEAVAVLDGGLAAWRESGGAIESGRTEVAPRPPSPLRPPLAAVVEVQALARRLGNVVLLDARASERFRGEVEPIDAQAGHIPGAINRPLKDNLDPAGRFKPPAELRAAFVALGGLDAPRVVHQCGSGVTACHNLLAMEVAGLHGSALYPGSWSEWSADPARPIARG